MQLLWRAWYCQLEELPTDATALEGMADATAQEGMADAIALEDILSADCVQADATALEGMADATALEGMAVQLLWRACHSKLESSLLMQLP